MTAEVLYILTALFLRFLKVNIPIAGYNTWSFRYRLLFPWLHHYRIAGRLYPPLPPQSSPTRPSHWSHFTFAGKVCDFWNTKHTVINLIFHLAPLHFTIARTRRMASRLNAHRAAQGWTTAFDSLISFDISSSWSPLAVLTNDLFFATVYSATSISASSGRARVSSFRPRYPLRASAWKHLP